MTDSIHKQIVDRIAALLAGIDGKLTVETNTPLPQEVPEDGLIIVRDAKPQPARETLGGFDTQYVIASVPVEVYVTHGDSAQRDAKYDELLQAVGTVLLTRDANGQRSLGGLVYGLVVDRPEPVTEPVDGAAAVKAATIRVNIEYSAPSALG